MCCLLWDVYRCVLVVVCALLCGVCSLLSEGMLSVARCLLFVVGCLSAFGCVLVWLFVVRCLLFVVE